MMPMKSAVPSWWTDLSPQEFKLIVESALAIPGIDDVMEGQDLAVGTVLPDQIPEKASRIFDGDGFRPENLRYAYLNGFRAYVGANPPADDRVIKQWALLTGPEQKLTVPNKNLRSDIIRGAELSYREFRRALITVCTNIGSVINDEEITGKRKKGHVILDHAAEREPLVKAGGKKVYRTEEGYLAHKRSGFQLSSGGRGRDDWTIMIDRATRHVQAKTATEALVAQFLGSGPRLTPDGYDAEPVWDAVQHLHGTLAQLKQSCWTEEFRGGLDAAVGTWSRAAQDGGKFAEVPEYAANRIAGSLAIMQSRVSALNEFNAGEYSEFVKDNVEDGKRKKLADPDSPMLREDLEELLAHTVATLQNYLNAYQGVYDAIVDGGERFYEWLCEWTKEQKEKGFRTEHPVAWGCCEAAKLLLMAASFSVKLTLNILSLGTASLIAAPLFMGADKACEKITDKIKEAFVGDDFEGLDRREKATQYLGKEYRTAQERMLGQVYELSKRAAKGAEFAAKGAEIANEIDEWRDRAELTAKVLHQVTESELHQMELAIQTANADAAREAMEKLKLVLNPIAETQGHTAETGLGGALDGLKLAVALGSDVITLIVPPELKKIVGDDGVELLEKALDRALKLMDEDKRKALAGELAVRRLDRFAKYAMSGSTFTVTMVLPDGDEWKDDKATIDQQTLRSSWMTSAGSPG
jgi:hypothetical protein